MKLNAADDCEFWAYEFFFICRCWMRASNSVRCIKSIPTKCPRICEDMRDAVFTRDPGIVKAERIAMEMCWFSKFELRRGFLRRCSEKDVAFNHLSAMFFCALCLIMCHDPMILRSLQAAISAHRQGAFSVCCDSTNARIDCQYLPACELCKLEHSRMVRSPPSLFAI